MWGDGVPGGYGVTCMGTPLWGHLYGARGHPQRLGMGGHHMLMVVFIATQGHGHPWGPPWGHGDLLRDILGDIKDLGTWTSLGTSFRTWTSLGTQGLGDIRTSLGTWGPPWGQLGIFGAIRTSLGHGPPWDRRDWGMWTSLGTLGPLWGHWDLRTWTSLGTEGPGGVLRDMDLLGDTATSLGSQ